MHTASSRLLFSKQALDHFHENRRFKRVEIDLLGRLIVNYGPEFECSVINISPGDISIKCPAEGQAGDNVIAYIDHIGRIQGKISRKFDNGFAVVFQASKAKQARLASKLTWLANNDIMNLPDDRRHERIEDDNNTKTYVKLPNGEKFACNVIDLSMSGVAVFCEYQPEMKTPVFIGKVKGRVVRHFEGGFAIEFPFVRSLKSVQEGLVT